MNWGELLHEETDAKGVVYRLYVTTDDLEIHGNVLASGDEEEDAKEERETIERLHEGDPWAWALVTCTAEYKGFSGRDHLGACSYRDTADFISPGGYWADMKAEALADLKNAVQGALLSAKAARQILKELGVKHHV